MKMVLGKNNTIRYAGEISELEEVRDRLVASIEIYRNYFLGRDYTEKDRETTLKDIESAMDAEIKMYSDIDPNSPLTLKHKKCKSDLMKIQERLPIIEEKLKFESETNKFFDELPDNYESLDDVFDKLGYLFKTKIATISEEEISSMSDRTKEIFNKFAELSSTDQTIATREAMQAFYKSILDLYYVMIEKEMANCEHNFTEKVVELTTFRQNENIQNNVPFESQGDFYTTKTRVKKCSCCGYTENQLISEKLTDRIYWDKDAELFLMNSISLSQGTRLVPKK